MFLYLLNIALATLGFNYRFKPYYARIVEFQENNNHLLMEPHYALSDPEFEKQFESAVIDPKLFSHEAHLRLAWIHVTKYGVERVAKNIEHQIAQFDRKFGDGMKFHSTVTLAAVKAVAHFVNKSRSCNFKDFMDEFPRLKSNFKDLLNQHYSFNVFKSEKARQTFVQPDLLAF